MNEIPGTRGIEHGVGGLQDPALRYHTVQQYVQYVQYHRPMPVL